MVKLSDVVGIFSVEYKHTRPSCMRLHCTTPIRDVLSAEDAPIARRAEFAHGLVAILLLACLNVRRGTRRDLRHRCGVVLSKYDERKRFECEVCARTSSLS